MVLTNAVNLCFKPSIALLYYDFMILSTIGSGWSRRILVASIFAVAIFFSLFHLKESPSVWYDEGWYVQASANLATTGVDGIQLSPGNIYHVPILTVGYPLIYPLSLWFKIFGVSIFSARLLMVMFVLGLLGSGYYLAKRLFSSTAAICTLALLVTLPPLYANGKSVLGEVPGMLYLVMSLVFLANAANDSNRKRFYMILFGVFAGLCVVTKPLFLVFVPAIALGLLIGWKRNTINFKNILISTIFGMLAVLTWLAVQFRGDGSLSQILSYYINPYEITDMVGTIVGNFGRLFTDVGTLYLTSMTIIWIVSLWVRHKKAEKVGITEIIAISFSLLVIAAYLRTAGWYRYLFEAQIISILFFPNALFSVAEYARQKFGQFLESLKPLKTPLFCVLVVFVLTVVGLYQLSFNSWVANAYNSDKTAFWEKYFETLPDSIPVFFYDTPEVAIFTRSGNYYQYLTPAGGVFGEDQLHRIEEGKIDKIIVRSDAYEGRKDSLFKGYEVDEVAYKYSILRQR